MRHSTMPASPNGAGRILVHEAPRTLSLTERQCSVSAVTLIEETRT